MDGVLEDICDRLGVSQVFLAFYHSVENIPLCEVIRASFSVSIRAGSLMSCTPSLNQPESDNYLECLVKFADANFEVKCNVLDRFV